MATINRTFSAKYGIDIANTVIVDSNRNVSNVNITSALINVTTANITTLDNPQLLAAYNQANDAYTAANSAANSVRVSANGGSTQNKVGLNFVNTNSIIVSVGPGADAGNANISFTTSGASAADAFSQANLAYAVANLKIETLNNGLGITIADGAGSPNVSKTISANVATTSTQGITKLVDSVSSTDSANAATAASVKTAYDQATAGYGQANAAYTQANAAFTTANAKVETIAVGEGLAVSSLTTANVKTTTVTANIATTTVRGITKLVDSVSTNDSANAATAAAVKTAYDAAVTAQTTADAAANTVRVSANGGSTLSKKQLNFVNTSSIVVTVTENSGNANIEFTTTGAAVATVYDQANLAYTVANSKVETLTNGLGITITNDAGSPNVAKTIAANVATTTDQGITKLIDSVSSTDTANAATANAVKTAWDYANTKVALTAANQTITGNVVIAGDLDVQGNIHLSGNTTFINVATLKVNDSIIQLSTNSIADILDIGFVGHYSNDGGTTNLHSGFIRHASDDKFYLFDGYTPEPTNNIIDVTHTSFSLATLRANLEANSITLNGVSVATVNDFGDAYDQANDAYTRANTVWDVANSKVETITAGLGLTSSVTTASPNVGITLASVVANTNVQGITKLIDSITSNDTGNAATANAVTWMGSTKVSKSGDTMTGKLTINVAGEGLEVAQANVSANVKIDQLFVKTATLTTTSVSQVTLDSWATASYTSAKYWVQMKEGTNVHTTEVLMVHDGTNAYITEYGTILSGGSLGSLTASISGGTASLLITPASTSSTTFKAVRYGVV